MKTKIMIVLMMLAQFQIAVAQEKGDGKGNGGRGDEPGFIYLQRVILGWIKDSVKAGTLHQSLSLPSSVSGETFVSDLESTLVPGTVRFLTLEQFKVEAAQYGKDESRQCFNVPSETKIVCNADSAPSIDSAEWYFLVAHEMLSVKNYEPDVEKVTTEGINTASSYPYSPNIFSIAPKAKIRSIINSETNEAIEVRQIDSSHVQYVSNIAGMVTPISRVMSAQEISALAEDARSKMDVQSPKAFGLTKRAWARDSVTRAPKGYLSKLFYSDKASGSRIALFIVEPLVGGFFASVIVTSESLGFVGTALLGPTWLCVLAVPALYVGAPTIADLAKMPVTGAVALVKGIKRRKQANRVEKAISKSMASTDVQVQVNAKTFNNIKTALSNL